MDWIWAAAGAHKGRPYSHDRRHWRLYGGSHQSLFFSVSSVFSVARFSSVSARERSGVAAFQAPSCSRAFTCPTRSQWRISSRPFRR